MMNRRETPWEHGLEYAALSDVGLRRSKNQDALAMAVARNRKTWLQRGHVFVVADGMGGYAAGELAAEMAVHLAPRIYRKLQRCVPSEALLESLRGVNRQIYDRGQASERFRGMGTTTSMLVLLPEGALLAHVGDSRIYRLRRNRLEQLTFDHSLVWELCAATGIDEANVSQHIPKNIITRCMGREADVCVDREGPFPIELGDTFLLCSDGLSGPVEDKILGTILGGLPPSEAVRLMVDLALLRGGKDNITAMVVRVAGPPPVDEGHEGGPHDSLDGSDGPARQTLGKGPYTGTDCAPSLESLEHLAEIVGEICHLAAQRDFPLDLSPLHAPADRADSATLTADPARAIRQQCRLVGVLAAQLRGHLR